MGYKRIWEGFEVLLYNAKKTIIKFKEGEDAEEEDIDCGRCGIHA